MGTQGGKPIGQAVEDVIIISKCLGAQIGHGLGMASLSCISWTFLWGGLLL